MKIGIISDTHENMPKIRSAVKLFNRVKVGAVIHCGDIISPITAGEFSALAAPFIGVFGNNDGEKFFLRRRFRRIGSIHERRYSGRLGGRRVLAIHEPDFLRELALSGRWDLIAYGHTHRAEISQVGSTLVVNPGEAAGWITGEATVALVDTGTMRAELKKI